MVAWVWNLSSGVNGKGSLDHLVDYVEVSPSEGHGVQGKSIWGLYNACYGMCRARIKGRERE